MSNDKNYYSILQWITQENICNEKGEPFDFHDRPFLLDILSDWNSDIVIKACAQVGKSFTFITKASFALKYLGLSVIHTFPTDDDVREFVASKVNKFLQANRNEFEGMDTDSIERKEINNRFWFFKGTVSKTAAISTTADILIHDEISRSDQLAIQTYKSRTKASNYKGSWIFSNPGSERDELDLRWQKSDQREWIITCPNCEDEHYLTFPESIDKEKAIYICKNCKSPISDDVRRNGKWVAQNPSSTKSGYHISHLMCCWIKPQEILDDAEGDPAYLNNFVLGEPYTPGDLSVNKSSILDIWTPKDLITPNLFLGVDVGNIKHYVVRSEKGIVKLGRFTKDSELDDLINYWKPVSGVIDAMPDNTLARYVVEKYPFMQMSYFMENSNNPQMIVWWGEGDKKGIVYSFRDRVIDQFLTNIVEARWLIGVPADEMFRMYIKHFETLRREKVVNNKGIEHFVWDSTTGEDHFVFADLYSYIAMLGNGDGQFWKEPKLSDKQSVLGADNNYDVSRAFSENNG